MAPGRGSRAARALVLLHARRAGKAPSVEGGFSMGRILSLPMVASLASLLLFPGYAAAFDPPCPDEARI